MILTKTESLTMNSRPKDPKTARNKNVLVIGGSGSGKTRFWLKPNLMQMHSSYVVTDPKGTILVECGKMLQRGTPKLGKDGKPMKDKHGKVIYEPYRIKVLNTINFKKSMHYNPFAYIHSEKDILKLVTTLIANTKGEGKAGDDFWVKAETLLYCALIGYIHYEAPVEEQNFSTLIEVINSMEVREDDEEYIFAGIAELMDDAVLDLRLGEHCFNRCGKSGQIIRTGDENILNAPVSQAVEYRRPKFGALIFTDPHTQNVLLAVQIDANGNIDSLLHDLALTAHMVVDGIQKDHRVDSLQRPLLPFFCNGKDLVRNAAYSRISRWAESD